MLPVKTFNGWKRFLESQEGFTLVEMITVVAIMGIILAIAVNRFYLILYNFYNFCAYIDEKKPNQKILIAYLWGEVR